MSQKDALSQDVIGKHNMALYDDYQPGIKAGSYRLISHQSVTVPSGGTFRYYHENGFVVKGPRYTLPPSDIHATFPPNGGTGDYKNILPHIVLKKRNLPWERLVWKDAADMDTPWLFLLVLTEKEYKDAVHQFFGKTNPKGPAPDLVSTIHPKDIFDHSATFSFIQNNKTILLPELDEEGDSQDTETKLQVVDLPYNLFLKTHPRHEDLKLTAHLRVVDPSNKVPLNMHADGQFSVIMANRFPQQGANRVFLLSMEGWGDTIAAMDGLSQFTPRALPSDKDNLFLRFVNLGSWHFVSDAKGIHTFGELCEELDLHSLSVETSSTNATVKAKLGKGYVPVEYQRSQSTPTVGWYRGPLSPLVARTSGQINANVEIFHAADSALIVDETNGLVDVSYASAWQLGRSLALASPSFSRGLRSLLDKSHDAFYAAQSLATFIKEFKGSMADWWKYEKLKDLPGHEHDPLLFRMSLSEHFAEKVSDAGHVMEWLARLALLYPVPFNFLIADAKLLPRESLRFFHIDNFWLEALVDGALSLGIHCSADHTLAKTLRSDYHKYLSEIVEQYRHHLKNPGSPPETSPPGTFMDDEKSGFLLRSDLVNGWPGLEVEVFDSSNQKMDLLRFDHLGQGVMFCMAKGKIDHVVFNEPREGIKFGIDDERAVMLRGIRNIAPVDLGDAITKNVHAHRYDTTSGNLASITPDGNEEEQKLYGIKPRDMDTILDGVYKELAWIKKQIEAIKTDLKAIADNPANAAALKTNDPTKLNPVFAGVKAKIEAVANDSSGRGIAKIKTEIDSVVSNEAAVMAIIITLNKAGDALLDGPNSNTITINNLKALLKDTALLDALYTASKKAIHDMTQAPQRVMGLLRTFDAAPGVLDVFGLFESLKTVLTAPHYLNMDTGIHFGSAAFGLQLMRAPEQQKIFWKTK